MPLKTDRDRTIRNRAYQRSLIRLKRHFPLEFEIFFLDEEKKAIEEYDRTEGEKFNTRGPGAMEKRRG